MKTNINRLIFGQGLYTVFCALVFFYMSRKALKNKQEKFSKNMKLLLKFGPYILAVLGFVLIIFDLIG